MSTHFLLYHSQYSYNAHLTKNRKLLINYIRYIKMIYQNVILPYERFCDPFLCYISNLPYKTYILNSVKDYFGRHTVRNIIVI
jgi:hypothetical protein